MKWHTWLSKGPRPYPVQRRLTRANTPLHLKLVQSLQDPQRQKHTQGKLAQRHHKVKLVINYKIYRYVRILF